MPKCRWRISGQRKCSIHRFGVNTSGTAPAVNLSIGRGKTNIAFFWTSNRKKRKVSVREKIAARARLVDWLKEQDVEGERILRTWKLYNQAGAAENFQSSSFQQVWYLLVDLLMKLGCSRLTVPAARWVYGLNQLLRCISSNNACLFKGFQ